MTSREFLLIESSLAKLLSGPYYKADRTEIETFQNDLRLLIKDKIRIAPEKIEDAEIQIAFPLAIPESPTTKSTVRMYPAKKVDETVDETVIKDLASTC